MKKPTETMLVRQVLDFLRHHKIFCWRANSGGGLRRGRGGRTVPVRGNPAGTPDVLAILPPSGRQLGVECKMPGGKLRPEQAAWAANATRAGALCVVVYDVTQLQSILVAEGVIV